MGGLLSHALVYNQARGAEDIKELSKLVDRGLMTEAELCVIQNMSSKSQVVWVWISQLIHGLASKGKVRHPGVMVPQFDVMCAKARASIGLLFTYTDTQLPYVWVHMLSTVVVLSMLQLLSSVVSTWGLCFRHITKQAEACHGPLYSV